MNIFTKFWFWLLILSIIGFIIFVVLYEQNVTNTFIWVLLGFAIFFFILSIILYIVDVSAYNIKITESCDNSCNKPLIKSCDKSCDKPLIKSCDKPCKTLKSLKSCKTPEAFEASKSQIKLLNMK